MSGGVPAFLFAILCNWILVDVIHVPVLLAYIVVLALQIIINFIINHYLVFNRKDTPTFRMLRQFFWYVIFFQGLSWLTYALMVKVFGIYYLLAQLINIALLSVFKFLWATKIFTKKTK